MLTPPSPLSPFIHPYIIYRIAYLLYAGNVFIRLLDCRSIEQRYCTLYRSWR